MQSETHTPPATPPAMRDFEMLRSRGVLGLAASPAGSASEVIALVRDRFRE